MREAIGATWIFGIVIVFIVVFTSYLAFSVNYAKAFAMKDSIIDILEKHNGPGTAGSDGKTDVLKEINEKMKATNYYSSGNCKKVGDAVNKTESSSESASLLYLRMFGVINDKFYRMANRNDEYFAKRDFHYCVIRQHQSVAYSGLDNQDTSLGFSNYFVATFFSIKIDIINIIKVDFNFFVSGQTKNIAYPNDTIVKITVEDEM